MRLLLANGRELGGADALIELARRIRWAWPLPVLAVVPGITPALRLAYGWVARHRHCLGPACRRHDAPAPRRAWIGWLPLVTLPLLAMALSVVIPRWVFMWSLAFAIYAGCKWLMWWRAASFHRRAGAARSLVWLIAWPGMDTRPFLDSAQRVLLPRASDWLAALTKTLLGATILWLICPLLSSENQLLLGWTGMVGTILLLHFGIFHLLALLWQHGGVNAQPIFDRPAAARSLGDFWGNRWNLGFRVLAHDLVFKPLAPRLGVAGAMMAVFIVSGLIHDLVISVPAGAGYGLPTAYFVLQGLGVLAERSPLGDRLGLRRGVCGRMFAILIIAGPAFWLFHPPFVIGVFIPFLRAIGAG
jgi:hypothetical protein